MINMIRADFYRIFRSAGIYIAFGMMLLIIGISIYTVSPGHIGNVMVITSDGDTIEEKDISSFPINDMSYEEVSSMSIKDLRNFMLTTDYKLDKDILRVNINLYYVFIFIAAVAVTADFSTGSVKNTLSSAISRNKYFVSKIITVMLITFIMFFLNTYLVYFLNIIFNNKNVSSDLWTMTKISLLQLPPVVAIAVLLSGIAFAVKKTSVYNVITIPFIMVFQLILMFISKLFKISDKFLSYELQFMIEKLAENPSGNYILNSYIICAGIVIVFAAIGYISFIKTEIR